MNTCVWFCLVWFVLVLLGCFFFGFRCEVCGVRDYHSMQLCCYYVVCALTDTNASAPIQTQRRHARTNTCHKYTLNPSTLSETHRVNDDLMPGAINAHLYTAVVATLGYVALISQKKIKIYFKKIEFITTLRQLFIVLNYVFFPFKYSVFKNHLNCL